jgi:hypothetical protein
MFGLVTASQIASASAAPPNAVRRSRRHLGLDPKKIGLDRDHPAHPPKQRGNAQHVDRRLRVIVRDGSGLESPVILGILQHVNHGFRGEAMAARPTPPTQRHHRRRAESAGWLSPGLLGGSTEESASLQFSDESEPHN